MSERKRLGKRVRMLRREKNWSQKELADLARLHRTYITDVERGSRNVSLLTMERLAKAFQIPISKLFSD